MIECNDRIEFVVWTESLGYRAWDNNNDKNYVHVHRGERIEPYSIRAIKSGSVVSVQMIPIGWEHRCGIVYNVNKTDWKKLEFFWVGNGIAEEIWEGTIPDLNIGDSIDYAIWGDYSGEKLWNNNHGRNFLFTQTSPMASSQEVETSNREMLNNGGLKRKTRNLIRKLSQSNGREAIATFARMLDGKTTEHDWQRFFDQHPYILSEGLHVKMDGLYSQVPLISGIPDYIFHGKLFNEKQGDFGVIELKRPVHSIIGSYSSHFIGPSRNLSIATEEAKAHLNSMSQGLFKNTNHKFALGNRKHAFIIIGRTSEIIEKCKNDTLTHRYRDLLPNGFNLFTYDELLVNFKDNAPAYLHIINLSSDKDHVEVEFELIVRNKMGLHTRPAAMICRLLQRYNCKGTASKDDERVNANSLMGLMMLAAGKGSYIRFKLSGPDAREAMNAMVDLWDRKFDEA